MKEIRGLFLSSVRYRMILSALKFFDFLSAHLPNFLENYQYQRNTDKKTDS